MDKLKVVLGMVFSLSFCGLIGQTQVSNENLLTGGAMEAPASWTVIDTGSDGPLSYEFNYTGELPLAETVVVCGSLAILWVGSK